MGSIRFSEKLWYKQTMLWIVGKSFSEFRRYLEDHGVSYGIFWDKSLPLPEDVTVPVIALDFTHEEGIAVQLEEHPDIDVSAVLVAGYENYVLPGAYIGRYYGVPAPSLEAAVSATDKAVMRRKFIEHDPRISPAFSAVTDWEDIEKFMSAHEFPVMLKPANLMKSLLITKNHSMDELREHYETTRQEIERLYREHSIISPPKIIIEEFLEGSMHTVAAFVDASGEAQIVPGVVDCITAQDMRFSDNFLYCRSMPSRLEEQVQEDIIRVAKESVRALGLTSCPAHIEIMLTRTGPKVIEVGARIGGYRPRMYEYAKGVDMYAAELDLVFGRQPKIDASAARSIAVFELFPDTEGRFEAITHKSALEELPSMRHFSIKPQPGDKIGRASHGYRAVAVAILGNDDAEQFRKDFDFFQENAKVALAD